MLIVALAAAIIVCWLLFRNKLNNNESNTIEQMHALDLSWDRDDVQASLLVEKSRLAENGVNTVAKNETVGIQTHLQATSPVEDRSFLTPHQQENERIKEGILDNMCAGTEYSIADMLY